MRVTAALVDHPPVVPSFAYRFDAADRSIVISGDTTRSDNVVELAQGADVLVHSALYVPAVDRMVARVANAATLKQSIIAHQTSAEDAGRVAAGRGREDAGALASRAARRSRGHGADVDRRGSRALSGEVIVGRDLLEV